MYDPSGIIWLSQKIPLGVCECYEKLIKKPFLALNMNVFFTNKCINTLKRSGVGLLKKYWTATSWMCFFTPDVYAHLLVLGKYSHPNEPIEKMELSVVGGSFDLFIFYFWRSNISSSEHSSQSFDSYLRYNFIANRNRDDCIAEAGWVCQRANSCAKCAKERRERNRKWWQTFRWIKHYDSDLQIERHHDLKIYV